MKFRHLSLFLLPLCAHAGLDPVIDAADRRLPESEALSRAAVAHSPARRALAARAYGQIMSPKGIDPLLRIADDPLPPVRAEAAFALGQLGWLKESAGGREKEIQAKLGALLRERQLAVRVAAAEALGKIGLDRAPELLGPALGAREPALRATAVMALFRARMVLKQRDPDHPPAALPDALRERLLVLARDGSAPVRESVAYFFARNAEPKAEATMAQLALDRDAGVRLFAITALGKMKAKASRSVLESSLRDKSYAVRVAGVGAFAATSENLAPFAAELLRDPTFHVRAATADALKPADADQLALLEATLEQDESPTVKAEALKQIAKAKNPKLLEAFLREQLGQPEWQLQEAAVQAADPLEAPAKEKFLLDALARIPNKLVRAAALDALFALPTPAAFDQLKRSLDSPELSERATAVGDLAGRKEPEAVELAWKTYQSSVDPKWVETREDLLDVFAKNPGDATTGYLKQALQDPDRGVRAKARAALQGRGAGDLPQYPDPELTYSPFREDSFRKNPIVEIETNRGTFTVECFPKDAPIHVADFLGHVKAGFYDGLPWHRVISNFVVQGGDPDGTGFGGAGYALRAEINRRPFARGALGMPRSQGFDTGGGQLFFSHIPTPHLDGQYTVFGRILKGVTVLDRLERGDKILRARQRRQ